MRASSGHGKNQLIVQQLTKAGNFLHLTLNASPIGLIDKTTCNRSLTLYTKVLYIFYLDSGLFKAALNALVVSMIFSHSYSSQRFGIYPEFRILFISYKNS